MELLAVWSLIAYVTYLLQYAEIFDAQRNRITSVFLIELLDCSMCVAFWVSLVSLAAVGLSAVVGLLVWQWVYVLWFAGAPFVVGLVILIAKHSAVAAESERLRIELMKGDR